MIRMHEKQTRMLSYEREVKRIVEGEWKKTKKRPTTETKGV